MPNPILTRRILSGGQANPILFRNSAGDTLAAATFSRASTATYRDVAGVLRFAGHNLILRSQEFDNGWDFISVSVNPNATAAPDGTMTADKLIEAVSASTEHRVSRGLGLPVAAWTWSVFAKAAERTWLVIDANDGATNNFTWFNLGAGTIGTTGAGATAQIETAPNGWYRCSVSRTSANTPGYAVFHVSTGDSILNYVGDGASGIYLWGAQGERNTVASAYLPTTTAARFDSPRDSHYALDPVSGLYKRSLLLEGARTNLALRSEEFGNATWSKNNCTATANAGAAPNGATTADRILRTGAAWNAQQAVTFTVASYTVSVWVKRNTGADQVFRLFGVSGASISADKTATSEWQLFSWTFTAGASAQSCGLISNVADTAVDILVWGFQVELGAFPSSYIPTTTATVTRAADSLSFPFTHPPQEMTVFARTIDAGSSMLINLAFVRIGTNSIFDSPRVLIFLGGSSTIQAWHSANTTTTLAVAFGESWESRLTMAASGNAQLGVSRNGAGETLSTTTSGPPNEAAWLSNNITLNAIYGQENGGHMAYRDIIIAKGIRDLAWFRARIAP